MRGIDECALSVSNAWNGSFDNWGGSYSISCSQKLGISNRTVVTCRILFAVELTAFAIEQPTYFVIVVSPLLSFENKPESPFLDVFDCSSIDRLYSLPPKMGISSKVVTCTSYSMLLWILSLKDRRRPLFLS